MVTSKIRRRRVRRTAVLVVSALAMAAGVTGCTSAPTTTQTPTPTPVASVQAGGTLRLAVADGLPDGSWDPAVAPESTVRSLGPLVMATLLQPAADGGAPSPGLATSAQPNADATVWTIQLRPGLSFSDGSPLTANDAAFWITQAAEQPLLKTRFGAVSDATPLKSATAVTPSTIVVTLRSPNALFDRLVLAAPEFGCVRKDYGGKSRTRYFARPLSCGAYVIESTKSTKVRLTRNPAYFAPAQVGPDVVEAVALEPGSTPESFLREGGDLVLDPQSAPLGSDAPTASPIATTITPTPAVSLAPSAAASVAETTTGAIAAQDIGTVDADGAGVVTALVFRAAPPTRDTNVRIAVQTGIDVSELVPVGSQAADSGLVPPGWLGAQQLAAVQRNPAVAQTAVGLVSARQRQLELTLLAGSADQSA
ncbi:MAG TPA: hypothetical protein DHW34_04370, partial [Actinobacteria bacterium]|nr:hypothetical protein [Actinomycetota bacterium]